MRHLLRKLERELVVERTLLSVTPAVDDLLSHWEEALYQNRPTPDPLHFTVCLIRPGPHLTTGPLALNYLDMCRRDRRLPSRRRLIEILVPESTPDPFSPQFARWA